MTYPLTSAMLTAPQSRGVVFVLRYLLVYIIFVRRGPLRSACWNTQCRRAACPTGDARSRPRCTGVGWVYQYALKGENLRLAELRSLQDWVMRLPSVCRWRVRGRQCWRLRQAILYHRRSGADARPWHHAVRDRRSGCGSNGHRLLNGRTVRVEFTVRGRGYLGGIADLEMVPIRRGRRAGPAA